MGFYRANALANKRLNEKRRGNNVTISYTDVTTELLSTFPDLYFRMVEHYVPTNGKVIDINENLDGLKEYVENRTNKKVRHR